MHIPDGYLSPSTCAALYAGSAPFWIVALRRVRRQFHTRMVPLISLVSAFCFVVMMFNLPLPGGTTGHAVGLGIAAVVLGPWAGVLSISVALAIQALFFGDGGITSYGANCFNMAVVGDLSAYTVYWLAAGRAALTAPRRVAAAALGGYVGINLAALCAAVEFGLQPTLFHDLNGAPLYAPYPLAIALPAMLIGHLSFAGLAEAVISGGLVAYLQRADPALLAATARGAGSPGGVRPRQTSALRPLWVGLAALMIVTPLGLLAAGTAWGEWRLEDFRNPEARQGIAAASGNVELPAAEPPAGMARLADLWRAPMPGYAPAFIPGPRLGYLLSAAFGGGVLIAVWQVGGFFLRRSEGGDRGG